MKAISILIPFLLYQNLFALDLISLKKKNIDLIQSEFKKARTPSLKELNKTKWNCSLLGVQSKLNSIRNKQLYSFSLTHKKLMNSAQHLFTNGYVLLNNSLESKKGNYLEQVKITRQGRLITKIFKFNHKKSNLQNSLTLESNIPPQKKRLSKVLVYSLCNKI